MTGTPYQPGDALVIHNTFGRTAIWRVEFVGAGAVEFAVLAGGEFTVRPERNEANVQFLRFVDETLHLVQDNGEAGRG